MAGYGSGDGFPWGSQDSRIKPNNQRLKHRISSVSDMSSPTSFSVGHTSPMDSMVSLPSPSSEGSMEAIDASRMGLSSANSPRVTSPVDGARRFSQASMSLPETLRAGTPTSPTSRGFHPFSRLTSPSYEPISPAYRPLSIRSLARSSSKRFSTNRQGSMLTKQRPIPEEEADLGLLSAASPFATERTAYGMPSNDEEEERFVASRGYDLSSFTGPMSPQNEAQQELHRQEAHGILTGGLGIGLKPDTTLRSGDLFATAATMPAAVSRRISKRNSELARAPMLRDLGQSEANKRGEIIEVIVDPAPVDLSSFAGDSTANVDFEHIEGQTQSRKTTFHASNVEVFYPQANWKPFSMRWLYLTSLILISISLAVAQEYLYQKSNRGPLYEFRSPSDLKTWDYFTFKYLPTMVAVTYGVLWQITDFEVKRLEAYYQLSKEGGALAAESINVDYITFFNFLRPLRALKFKHYAVAVSSVATLLAVSLVPTLQSASVALTPDRTTRQLNPTGLKEIHIHAGLSRGLSCTLIIIAALGCKLFWQLQRRRSGLVADVKGIAGIAAMANRSHILMDFKDMDTATPELIHQKLKGHRYTLRNSSLAPDDQVPVSREDRDKYDQYQRPENPHPLMLRLIAGIPFIIGMLLFLVIVPVILFTKANVITDKAPWLLTGLAVCIKLAWGTLETDVRMIEPFYLLSRRHASPKVLTLDYTAMAFGWMPVRAFLNGHFLVALVGLGSVLAEILTVCATSFSGVVGVDFAHPPPPNGTVLNSRQQLLPYASDSIDSGEETLLSFWVSFGLSVFILSFLCLVAAIVYWRRRHPFLPRQPNTIASILAFIHQSKMLYDFVGTEKLNNDDMVKRLVEIGKTYGLGWFTGRDGETHCGVDEEELTNNYKHGDDVRKASKPWTTDWENY